MAGLSCTNAILSLMWQPVETGCIRLLCDIQTAFKPLPIPSFLSCNCFLLSWGLKRLNTPLIIPNWRSPRVTWAAHVWEDLLVGSTQRIAARTVPQGRELLGPCAPSPALCPEEASGRGESGTQTVFRKFSVLSLHWRLSVNFHGVGIGHTQIIVCRWKKEEATPSEWLTLTSFFSV